MKNKEESARSKVAWGSAGRKIKKKLLKPLDCPLERSGTREIEQLMGLCDELESKLRKGREESERMMQAVVRGLIEGATAAEI